MHGRLRALLAGLAIVAVLQAAPAAASQGFQEKPGSVPVLFDAWILRPVGLVMTGVGFVRFALTVPWVAITRPTDIKKVWRSSVVHPARYTFADPLGFHPDRKVADFGEPVP